VKRPSIALAPALFLLLLAPAAPIAAGAAPSERPNFSGAWKLNVDASDNPREKMHEAMHGRGGPGGGFGGRGGYGRGGGGGGPGGGGGGMGGPGGSRGRGGYGRGGGDADGGGRPSEDTLHALDEELAHLTIVHVDPQLTIRYGDGRERVLWTDGRDPGPPDPSVELPVAAPLLARASWDRQKLTVHGESPRGGKVTEVYELVADGKRLFVDVTTAGNGRMPKMTIRRVYDVDTDAEPPSEPAPAAPAPPAATSPPELSGSSPSR
jgi:hypothetical protein